MNRGSIKLNNAERFQESFSVSEEKLSAAIEAAVSKLRDKIDVYTDGFPHTSSRNFRYKIVENSNWVCGLQTGCYLLAYELTGDTAFLEVAGHHLKSYENRIEKRIKLSDHDVGFVYSPSCVAYYKVTGDEYAKELALRAADILYDTCYTKEGGFILRADYDRSSHDEKWLPHCRTMMDTMLNIPLFYWAGKVSGNEKFTEAANSQAEITNRCLVRADGSTYHHYQFALGTFQPLFGLTFQGNRDESTWSRGHAWGVLGFPIAYGYTGLAYMPLVQRDLTYFFLNHLPEDYIPYWDFDYTSGDEPRDTSAGAIAACGMLEAARVMPETVIDREIYKNASNRIVDSIIDRYTAHPEKYDGLLTGVTACRRMEGYEHNACALYGDYFYLEALMRLKNPDWKMYW